MSLQGRGYPEDEVMQALASYLELIENGGDGEAFLRQHTALEPELRALAGLDARLQVEVPEALFAGQEQARRKFRAAVKDDDHTARALAWFKPRFFGIVGALGLGLGLSAAFASGALPSSGIGNLLSSLPVISEFASSEPHAGQTPPGVGIPPVDTQRSGTPAVELERLPGQKPADVPPSASEDPTTAPGRSGGSRDDTPDADATAAPPAQVTEAPAGNPAGPGATPSQVVQTAEQRVGPEGTPPGQGGENPGNGVGPSGTPPGQGGENPGNGVGPSGTPPGQGGENPGNGNGGTPPGQGGQNPGNGNGNGGTPPGQGGENPGNGGTPPGQGGENPGNGGGNGNGNGGTPPGQGGENPGNGGGNGNGNGGNPPGQQDDGTPGNSDGTPGGGNGNNGNNGNNGGGNGNNGTPPGQQDDGTPGNSDGTPGGGNGNNGNNGNGGKKN